MISLIAAIGKNGELGKNNDLIWHLKGDMQFFKETTLNHKVVMGYNTYLSIGKKLPNRQNVVLVNDKNLVKDDSLIVYDNIDELLKKEIPENEEVFIIGGASLYNYFINLADKMYLTLIEAEDNEAQVFFPKIDNNLWHKKVLKNQEEEGIRYQHVLMERI